MLCSKEPNNIILAFWLLSQSVLTCFVSLFQGPVVTMDALYLDFGLLAVGESVSKQLPLFNHSRCPVRFSLSQAIASGGQPLPVEDLEWDKEGLPKLSTLVLYACVCASVCVFNLSLFTAL